MVAAGGVRVVLDASAVQEAGAAARAVDYLRPVHLRALEQHRVRFGGGSGRRRSRALLRHRSRSFMSRTRASGVRLGAVAFPSVSREALQEQLEAGAVERPDALEADAAVDRDAR